MITEFWNELPLLFLCVGLIYIGHRLDARFNEIESRLSKLEKEEKE